MDIFEPNPKFVTVGYSEDPTYNEWSGSRHSVSDSDHSRTIYEGMTTQEIRDAVSTVIKKELESQIKNITCKKQQP